MSSIRQSKKTDKQLMKKYLDSNGAIPGSYRLHESLNGINPLAFYSRYKVGSRSEQIETFYMINNFDGIAHIRTTFEGNDRVEDYVFPTFLNIYWDESTKAKRLKRIKKIKSKINS